jgi:hypothetical protein
VMTALPCRRSGAPVRPPHRHQHSDTRRARRARPAPEVC